MITLRDVGYSYVAPPRTTVETLAGISLTVSQGEFVSIVGPSGCGKSTLLELIAGLKTPSQGTVTMDGRPVGHDFGWAGYLTQADSLLPWRTVLDNACLGLAIRGESRTSREKRVRPLLERLGLAGFENAYPAELSGGMVKRAALARLLAYGPQVLLLDEPFAPLDAQTRERLQADLLTLWRDFGKTVILVTHDITEAVELSGRIAVLGPRPASLLKVVDVNLPYPRAVFDPSGALTAGPVTAEIRTLLGTDSPIDTLPAWNTGAAPTSHALVC